MDDTSKAQVMALVRYHLSQGSRDDQEPETDSTRQQGAMTSEGDDNKQVHSADGTVSAAGRRR